MNNLVFDLEATGLNILTDEPISLTVYNPQGDQYHNWFINSKVSIDPGAMAVHGLTKEFILKNGYAPFVAAEAYNALIWENWPVILLGYNCTSFDFPMLQNFLARHNKKVFKHPPVTQVIDVMHLVGAQSKSKKWPKLSEVADRLGIVYEPEILHTSKGDCWLTWKIYEKVSNIDTFLEGGQNERN